MNNSETIQDLQFEISNLRDRLKADARTINFYIQREADLLKEVAELNKTHYDNIDALELRMFEAESKNVTKDVLLGNAEHEIAKLDSMLNKTIDAHTQTRERLLGYENEVGVPMSASEREAYVSYQETVAHNERMNRMQD